MKRRIPKMLANLNLINLTALKSAESLVFEAETNYKNQIHRLVRRFLKNENHKVILLSGPSSSGKTTTSKFIRNELQEKGIHSIVISLDDFFKNRENTPRLPDGSYDFETIYALDLDYFNVFLNDLLKNNKAKMPSFDFFTGTRKSEYVDIEIDDNSVVIFEGIHALNPLLIKDNHSDEIFKVYVCVNTNFLYNDKVLIPAKDLRLMRRMIRDYNSRGYSIAATLSMWPNVLAGEEKYIKPFKEEADFVIDSTHFYEPLLYAEYLSGLLEKTENNSKATEILKMLSKCNKIKKISIPSQSLLWEFIVY